MLTGVRSCLFPYPEIIIYRGTDHVFPSATIKRALALFSIIPNTRYRCWTQTGKNMDARSKKKALNWCLAIFIALLFSFMFIALCAVLDDPKKGLASAEAAAWVQAIGSIGAIFAVIWVSNDQLKKQRQIEQQRLLAEAQRLNQFVSKIVKSAISTIANVETSQRDWKVGVGYEYREIRHVESDLIAIRTLMMQPLPAHLIELVMMTNKALLDVNASANQTIGSGPSVFRENASFEEFWSQQAMQVAEIEFALNNLPEQ